eukprot:scaffold90869_cov38-Prasinocladus_malaysianus.AAC.1
MTPAMLRQVAHTDNDVAGLPASAAAEDLAPPAKRVRDETSAHPLKDINAEMQKRGEIHEYTSMANPSLPLIPVVRRRIGDGPLDSVSLLTSLNYT